MWRISAILQTLWMGKYSLGKSFWLFFCLGYILIIPVAMGVRAPFIIFNFPKLMPSLVFWIVFFGYEIVASVGVWRSANALLGNRMYVDYLKVLGAKMIVIITMIGNIVRLTGVRSIDQIVALFSPY